MTLKKDTDTSTGCQSPETVEDEQPVSASCVAPDRELASCGLQSQFYTRPPSRDSPLPYHLAEVPVTDSRTSPDSAILCTADTIVQLYSHLRQTAGRHPTAPFSASLTPSFGSTVTCDRTQDVIERHRGGGDHHFTTPSWSPAISTHPPSRRSPRPLYRQRRRTPQRGGVEFPPLSPATA